MDKPFYNEKRIRYYGVRVGDLVRDVFRSFPSEKHPLGEPVVSVEGYVTELGFMDNNCVYVDPGNGNEPVKCIPENLIILVPVETLFPGKLGGSIVTNDPWDQPHDQPDNVNAYGGFVVAETVPARYMNLFCAAPDLLKALELFEKLDKEGKITIWSNQREIMNKALRIARYGNDD